MADFDAARDKIMMGAKREEVITEKDKRPTAYHEVGHALVAWLTPKADPVHKVTIIPRGRALGVTQFLPRKTASATTRARSRPMLAVALGGRAAERLVFDDLSAGRRRRPRSRRPGLARLMVTQCGHERPRRAGLLPRLRGTPVPRPRDERAARPLRAHRPAHRRGGRPHPPRGRRPRLPPARRTPRRARTPDRGPDRARGPVRQPRSKS